MNASYVEKKGYDGEEGDIDSTITQDSFIVQIPITPSHQNGLNNSQMVHFISKKHNLFTPKQSTAKTKTDIEECEEDLEQQTSTECQIKQRLCVKLREDWDILLAILLGIVLGLIVPVIICFVTKKGRFLSNMQKVYRFGAIIQLLAVLIWYLA